MYSPVRTRPHVWHLKQVTCHWRSRASRDCPCLISSPQPAQSGGDERSSESTAWGHFFLSRWTEGFLLGGVPVQPFPPMHAALMKADVVCLVSYSSARGPWRACRCSECVNTADTHTSSRRRSPCLRWGTGSWQHTHVNFQWKTLIYLIFLKVQTFPEMCIYITAWIYFCAKPVSRFMPGYFKKLTYRRKLVQVRTYRCCRRSTMGGRSSPGQTPPPRWCTARSCHTGCRRAAGSRLCRCTRRCGGRTLNAPDRSHTLHIHRERKKKWTSNPRKSDLLPPIV